MKWSVTTSIASIHVSSIEEEVLQVVDHPTPAHLVHLLPPLQVLGSNVRVVMEQGLCDAGVGVDGDDAMVERGQVLAVSVVRTGSQLQHRPHRLDVVADHGPVHPSAPVLGPEVKYRSSIDKSHHHARGS